MASGSVNSRRKQIHDLILSYEKDLNSTSKTKLVSALREIPVNEIAEVLSKGYFSNGFHKICHEIKEFFAKLFSSYNRKQQYTVLHSAIKYRHTDVIGLILNSINSDQAYSLLKMQSPLDRCTALNLAVLKNNIKAIEYMRAAVNFTENWLSLLRIPNELGWTPVHTAADNNNTDAITAMLNNLEGKSQMLKLPELYGNSALHLAVKGNNLSMIHGLTEGLDGCQMSELLTIQNAKMLETPIHLAAKYVDTIVFDRLLSQLDNYQVVRVLTKVNTNLHTPEDIAKKYTGKTPSNHIQEKLSKAENPNSVPAPIRAPIPVSGTAETSLTTRPGSYSDQPQPSFSGHSISSSVTTNIVESVGKNHFIQMKLPSPVCLQPADDGV